VRENQRQRLLRAAALTVAERGYAKMTVAAIVDRAEISRATFYELFDCRDDCLHAAYEDARQRLRRRISEGLENDGDWSTKVTAAVEAGLEFFAAEPSQARLLTLEINGGGPEGVSRRRPIDAIARLLRIGREEYPDAKSLPQLTEEFFIEGMTGVISDRLLADKAHLIPSLAPQFVDLIISVYAGPRGTRDLAP
jgi:AcrR family transcriptional regulator